MKEHQRKSKKIKKMKENQRKSNEIEELEQHQAVAHQDHHGQTLHGLRLSGASETGLGPVRVGKHTGILDSCTPSDGEAPHGPPRGTS